MSFSKLLLNQSQSALTANTIVVTGSSLTLDDGVYSNDQSGLNQGIVTPYNVNNFLNNPINSGVSTAYFSYLTGNTNDSQFREIVYNNKKLSESFTDFYSQVYTSGQSPSDYIVYDYITGTTEIEAINYNYRLSNAVPGNSYPPSSIYQHGDRVGENKKYLVSLTNEESFYINLEIKRNYTQLSRLNFTEYSQDRFRTINDEKTFLGQGFVYLNKNNNPNNPWSNSLFPV